MEKFDLPEGLEILSDVLDAAIERMQAELRLQASVEAIRPVLWYFGDRELGQEPGGFVSRLLDAMSHADSVNLVKLANEYQEYAFLIEQAKQTEDGMEWMRSRVRASQGAAWRETMGFPEGQVR